MEGKTKREVEKEGRKGDEQERKRGGSERRKEEERRETGRWDKEGGMAHLSELWVSDTQVTFTLSAPLPAHTHTHTYTGAAKNRNIHAGDLCPYTHTHLMHTIDCCVDAIVQCKTKH